MLFPYQGIPAISDVKEKRQEIISCLLLQRDTASITEHDALKV